MNTCVDCGKELKWGSARCRSCWKEHNKAQKYFCIDCGKEIGWGATRCQQCAWVARRKLTPKNYCVDCRAEICSVSTRCRQCAGKTRRGISIIPGPWAGKKQSKEMCEKKSKALKGHLVSSETRRKIGKGVNAAHERGCYNGVYQSPTQPEKDVMEVLTELGFEYRFNEFNLKGYVYDFYLPSLGVLIEYDGWYWHQCLDVANDGIKDKLADEQGLTLIRLQGDENHDLTKREIMDNLQNLLGDDCGSKRNN